MADTTIRDILQDALEKIGVYAAGETLSDADAERCLTIANNMLDSWSNESLACYANIDQSGPLLVGKTAYTIGQSGTPDFSMIRPLRLIDGPGSAYLVDSNNNRYPVDVVPQTKWNQIWNITSVTSNLPDTIFYDPQFPNGIINVYPSPNLGGMVLHWLSTLQLVTFTGLTGAGGTISLPSGYKLALVDNLARAFWRYFKADNSQIPLDIIDDANRSKATIKRVNQKEVIAQFDRVLTAKGAGTYNPYSDGVR